MIVTVGGNTIVMNYNLVMLCGKCKECWKKLLFLLLSHSVRNAGTFVDYYYKYNFMDQTKLNVNKHAVAFVKEIIFCLVNKILTRGMSPGRYPTATGQLGQRRSVKHQEPPLLLCHSQFGY